LKPPTRAAWPLLAHLFMTLHEELIKLAFSFVGITLIGGALTAFWSSRQKRREIEAMELKYFYDHYGKLLAACRLWNAVKDKKVSLPGDTTRYDLLKQATESEGALEGMLLKLASERLLTSEEQSGLGQFRQGYQTPRQSIRDDREVPWRSSQAGLYLEFKEGAALFASLLRSRVWTRSPCQEAARKAVWEITHNKHEHRASVSSDC
jgi:hypothetical protein